MHIKTVILLLLLLTVSTSAQNHFRVNNPSRTLSIDIDVEKCDEGFRCAGKSTFAFSRNHAETPFQIIKLPDTYLRLEEGKPQVNVTLLYDEQSVLNFDDFNFDGFEDVAICDGNNGGYGMPSYQVYLYSKKLNRFVHSTPFTKLGKELGMFEVDAKRKRLATFSKSGCCWHQTAEYIVVNNLPKKVLEVTEDATYTGRGGDKVKVTTRKLIKGRWRTSTKYVKHEE